MASELDSKQPNETLDDGALENDQIAQATLANEQLAGTPEADQPIGQVNSMSGTVTVIHSDGETSELNAGDPVYQGDTIETGDDGSIGVILADETVFSMADNGSIVLDEMIYDPASQEGSVSLSAVEGVFTFVSGQVARTDPDSMTVETPVATIGIRGTQVGIDLNGEEGADIVLMVEDDGFVGEVVVQNEEGVQVLNMAHSGVNVSHGSPPSMPFNFEVGQIVNQFGQTFHDLPDDGNANHYDDHAKDEDSVEEGMAEEEGEDGEGNEGDVEEGMAKEESGDEGDGEDLAEFETAAGDDSEGFEEDFTNITDGNDATQQGGGPGFSQAQGRGQSQGRGDGGNRNSNQGDHGGGGARHRDEEEKTHSDEAPSESTVQVRMVEDDANVGVHVGGAITIYNVSYQGTNYTPATPGNPVDLGIGTVEMDAGGAVVFTPVAGQFNSLAAGEETQVNFTATYSDGSSSNVFITVTGTNDVPVVSTPIVDMIMDEDAAFSLDVSSHFSDADTNDTLEYSATLANGDPLPDWLSINPATGEIIGTPLNGDVGKISIIVTATDSSGTKASDTFNVEVTNTNDGPVATVIDDQTVDEEGAFSLDISGNFSDVDVGDSLTFSATQSDGSLLPSWMSIDPATGVISGTPADGDDGTVSITVTATDKSGASASDTFDVTVNDVVSAPADATAEAPTLTVTAETASFGVSGGEGSAADTVINLNITFALVDTDGSEALSNITISGIPSGVVLSAGTDNGDGSWTLSSNDLSGLTMNVPSSVSSDFNISVSGTSTESSTGDTATSTSTVDINAVNDGVTLSGGEGGDTLTGTDDWDTLDGMDGDDILYGLGGDDTIDGGKGDDTITGGDGNDTIDGGKGDDTLTGGDGNDTFVFNAGEGDDSITDFSIGDVLNFEGSEFDPSSLNVTQDGNDVVITFGGVNDTSVRLEDTNVDDLQSDDGSYSITQTDSDTVSLTIDGS